MLARRIGGFFLRYLLAVLLASIVVFVLLRIAPGDPAQIALGLDATDELLAQKRAELGTDQPLIVQYGTWLGGMLTGHFGSSLISGTAITPLVWDRLQVTAILVVCAMVVAIAIAVPLGIWAAMRRRHADGIAIAAMSQVGIAIPSFVAAILLVTVIAVQLGWLPSNGWVPPADDFGGFVRRLILPVLALAMVQSAILTRYVRSAVLDVTGEDYMRTARAKGLSRWRTLIGHGLHNASLPVLTVAALQLAALVTGAVVIEHVFVIPGIGSLLLEAVSQRDLPIVQAIVMLLVVITLSLNFLVEVTYALLDPRLRT
ncbi:ABC transporter permease [Corynebacterium choanae]|uniref:Nickel transport system permease protein NikB n=1 Tax=Corynebacterium choanae TaxID=1862358 RepID=A0A3G6J8I2_9CORY|nr:ABC transporter permease [Corynebacterium choanae]AZA14083.1 Nickel transport system permease protein NikB [Corynebacterium choanae]